MPDKKLDETRMEETVQSTTTVVHDYDELLKNKADAQKQIETLTAYIKDLDAIRARMDSIGCKPKEEPTA